VIVERTHPGHWPASPPTNSERIASWQSAYRYFANQSPQSAPLALPRPRRPGMSNSRPYSRSDV